MKEEGGGGSEIFSTTKEGAPKKIEPLARGAAKISSFEFQYLHPPPLVILNELSLTWETHIPSLMAGREIFLVICD